MKKPELLVPAGNLEKLKIAVLYGADAVFLGYQEYGLRSNSDNFSIEDLKEAYKICSEKGVKIYVTTNIYAHEENFVGFVDFIKQIEQIGITGIIVSDPGYIMLAKEHAPKLEIHISTQHSITNYKAVEFYEKLGAERVVLARELTFEEIKEITDKSNIEIEVFIHGAVCSSYSGRCTISNHMTGRDSNRGGCCQSCRWDFDIYKGDEKYTLDRPFSMSAKDSALLCYIPELVKANIDSLKIEGRMKSFHYCATVTKVYRQAIDTYFEDPENYDVKQEWIEELQKAEARITHPGAIIGDLTHEDQIYGEQYKTDITYDYCGYVLDYLDGYALIEQRNFFKVGDTVEFFGPNGEIFTQVVEEIINLDNESIEKANHPLMNIKIKTIQPVESHFLMRRIIKK